MSRCQPERPRPKPKTPRPKRVSKPNPARWRERTKKEQRSIIVTHPQTLPVPMPEPVSYDHPIKWERFYDTSGFLQSWYNPAFHEKLIYKLRLAHGQLTTGDVLTTTEFAPPEWLTLIQEAIRRVMPQPPPEILDAFSRSAFLHFKTAVKPEVLLGNFLLELVALVKDAPEIALKLKERWIRGKKAFDRHYAYLLKQGVDSASAWLLAWNFAIAPFMDDLEKIVCSFSKSLRRYEWLVKHNGEQTQVHFRRNNVWKPEPPLEITVGTGGPYGVGSWQPEHPPWEGGPPPLWLDIPCRYVARLSHYDLTMTAQGTVIVRIPSYKLSQGGALQVWMSMMSLDRPLATGWEAIPFSFVIDWFTDEVKNLVDYGDSIVRNYPEFSVMKYGAAVKVQLVWDIVCINDYNHQEEFLGTIVHKFYKRGPGLPTADSRVFDTDLTVTQWAESGALMNLRGLPYLKRKRKDYLKRKIATTKVP